MNADDSTPPARDTAIPLDPSKAMHVFGDRPLTGVERELESRRFIWIHSLLRSIEMARVSIRAHAWFIEAGPKWSPTDQAFPTPFEGALASRGMAQMAVITFLTMFKSGWEDKGNVAGNDSMKTFRERCLSEAFPETQQREAFASLLKRLEGARDGLLAHADGAAQKMEYMGNLTSFRPQDDGVSREDVASLLEFAERLSEVVQRTKAA